MTLRVPVALAAVLAVGPLSVCAGDPPGSAASPPVVAAPDWEAQLAAKAPAIVTLRYLAAFEATNEYPMSARGVVIDASGLVLASNESFGDASVKIRGLKVLVGAEPKEWAAILVARDTALDLAYVQIVDAEGKAFVAIDVEKGRDPRLGEDLFGVTRRGRGSDYAPTLKRIYVTSRIESPRLVFDVAGDFLEAGLPVFDRLGAPVGVLVNQDAAVGDDDGAAERELFLLPLAAVTKSVAAVRKRIPDAVAKARAAADDAPAAPATDAPREAPIASPPTPTPADPAPSAPRTPPAPPPPPSEGSPPRSDPVPVR